MSTQTIGFIGAGNMASSIIGGLLATGFDTSRILASDPDQPQRELLEDKFSIQCFENNQDVVNAVSVVVLAIKPQKMKQAIESINQALVKNQPLIISIAAGLRNFRYDSLDRRTAPLNQSHAEYTCTGKQRRFGNVCQRPGIT